MLSNSETIFDASVCFIYFNDKRNPTLFCFSLNRTIQIMLILLAGHHKMFSKKIYLSGMKYDVKNDVLVKYVTEAYVLNNFLKIFSCL